MCDYSLMHVKSRDAVTGDELVTHSFGSGTIGFRSAEDTKAEAAVCIRPGAELELLGEAKPSLWQRIFGTYERKVAVFRQINVENKMTHHDALQFLDGSVVLIHSLGVNRKARVLQMPAKPRNHQEQIEQTRVPVVA